MALFDISKNPLALDTFRGKIGTLGLERAVAWARDAGFYVRPELLPTPKTDLRTQLVDRGGEGAAAVFDSLEVNREGFEAEQRAIELARAVADGGSSLERMTTPEKVDAIMAKRAGLGPLASVEALHDLGQHHAADEFERRNFRDVHRERIAREEVTDVVRVGREINAKRENAKRRILSAAPKDGNGAPVVSAAIKSRLDEIDREHDAELDRAVADTKASFAKQLRDLTWAF